MNVAGSNLEDAATAADANVTATVTALHVTETATASHYLL